jgi:YVTN family beta-propeller protein
MRPNQVFRLAVALLAASTFAGCTLEPSALLPRPTAARTRDPSPTTELRTLPRVVVPVLAQIEMRSGQFDVALVESTGELYVGSQDVDTITVIDAADGRVVDTLAGGFDPGSIVPDQSAGVVYVADIDDRGTGGVTVIDAQSHGFVDRIQLPGTDGAWRMALDASRHRLFVTSNDGRISVVDTRARRFIRSIKVDAFPEGVAVEADEGTVFISDAGGIAGIDTETLRVLNRVQSGGRGMLTVDDEAGMLFAANQGEGTVTVFDTATLDVLRTIRVASSGDRWGPWHVALDPSVRRAYVCGGVGVISVLDLETLDVLEMLAPEPGAQQAFGTYAVVDTATNSVFITSFGPGTEGPDGPGFVHEIERR